MEYYKWNLINVDIKTSKLNILTFSINFAYRILNLQLLIADMINNSKH